MPTVLVVDDERLICALLTSILEHEGFTVITAGSGAEALSAFRSHDGAIDLLISDVCIPGMDGPSLASELLALAPGMAVLFISGEEDFERCRGFELLCKPFPLAVLVEKVRGLMQAPRRLAHASQSSG